MKISIVTASYNQANYLEGSLSSVQSQRYNNYEHIIFDGMSTDGSQDILRTYAANNTNVHLVIKEDGGQVQAINNGLKVASGDVLTWLNTDDFLFDSEVLERVAKEFEDPSVDVVYGRGWYVDDQGSRVRNVYVKPSIKDAADLISSIGVFQPALYFRRSVFERVGGLDARYQLTLDYEYWIRMLQNGIRFSFLDVPLAKATLHEDSKTVGSRSAQLIETLLLVKARYGYVHPDWLERFSNYLLHQADWTTKEGREAELAKPNIEKINADDDICFLSELAPTRMARTDILTRASSLNSASERIIVTSFDSNYFAQGLNLIASIHVHAKYKIDRIVVYDLGLTEAQLGLLNTLEGIIIDQYPIEEPWPGYLSPKSYMYKCHAIYDARKYLASDKAALLWVDAGVCVTGSLDEIFDKIQAQGIFLINHDDRRSPTMINAAFTHPLQVEYLQLDERILKEDHVCSCVLGYRPNTIGEKLAKEVQKLSLLEDINNQTKHPNSKWLRATAFNKSKRLSQRRLNADAKMPHNIPYLADFPYYGHRQDQSLYSNIAALMGLPISSAQRYCPATDYSSKISYENWKSGGEASSIKRSDLLPEDHKAPLFHHRGTYTNISGLLTDRSAFISDNLAFVLGNGPSLKNLPFSQFKNIATIGMNAAYRYWDEVGWYPSYYCCMDTVVIMSHAEEIYRLIRNSDSYGIKYFFLRNIISEKYPELLDHPKVIFLEDLRPLSPLFQVEPITTGSYSLMFLTFMGFRRIYLAGVDCNYVERIDEITDGDKENKLIVVKDVESNPNYFFDSYQQPGDEYNVPNPSKDLHVRSWMKCAETLNDQLDKLGEVRVINLNLESRVNCFENDAIEIALKDIDGISSALSKKYSCSSGFGYRSDLIANVQSTIRESIRGKHEKLKSEDIGISEGDLEITKIRNARDGYEIRLTDCPSLNTGDVVTVVYEFTADQKLNFNINILHVNSWGGEHKA